jgi:hypothetical protein
MVDKRRRERRAGLLMLAIALVVLGCGAVAVAGLLVIGAVTFSDTDRDHVSPDVVESIARVRLTPGARDLRSHLEGFQDRLIWVRFSMPEHELPAFERSLTCKLGASSPAPPALPTASRPAWWTDAKLSRACRGSGPGFTQSVIVDISAAPDLVVFVVVFES